MSDATAAIKEGRLDDAIALLEQMGDQGTVGASLAFDRGIAYALRARSGRGLPGDYGRAAHAFEEALRRDPHDDEARKVLDEIRREIAARDAQAKGKAEELAAQPAYRAVLVALPGDAWAAFAIASSLLLAIALAVRPRLTRGARLASSTTAVVAALVMVASSGMALGARWLRTKVREAVVVAPRVIATPVEEGSSIELDEGQRVDVVEERATSTMIRTEKGVGWAPRDALRPLPPYRP
jgi:tetratricopeptide (TPR) repeat protein